MCYIRGVTQAQQTSSARKPEEAKTNEKLAAEYNNHACNIAFMQLFYKLCSGQLTVMKNRLLLVCFCESFICLG